MIARAKRASLFRAIMAAARQQLRMVLFGLTLALGAPLPAQQEAHYGFLYDLHQLTLESGWRQEILGPLYYHTHWGSNTTCAVCPLFSWSRNSDPDLDIVEWDILYPLISHDRFGSEYRLHFLQFLSFAGGQSMDEEKSRRLTLFPLFFHQRSQQPTNDYTAFIPFYGHIRGHLLRDEIRFIALPVWLQTRKRDVVTDNYFYPFVHIRRGEQLSGWQIWPFMGREHRGPYTITNRYGDLEIMPGHDKNFILWPFYLQAATGLGTTNEMRQTALLPFFNIERSPGRDSTSYLWPLGLTLTDDRQRKYFEVGAPWPLIVFAHGEGKTTRRVWPFFSESHNAFLQSDFYAWPIYKYNRVKADPLDRERVRILLFVYSDMIERNTQAGESRRRTDLWPIFTHRRDADGNQRLQALSVLEPLIPNNKSIERNHSPLWSVWRSEKNGKTGAASDSFLWNFYRHDTATNSENVSLLFGMFQYKKSPEGNKGRFLFIPFSSKKAKAARDSVQSPQ